MPSPYYVARRATALVGRLRCSHNVSRFALPSKLRPSFNMQVLVADDQGINRKLMCQLLSTFNSSC